MIPERCCSKDQAIAIRSEMNEFEFQIESLYPEDPELAHTVKRITTDYLERVSRYLPDQHSRAIAIDYLWEYDHDVMPNELDYGPLCECLSSFSDLSQIGEPLTTLRGYILAETIGREGFPDTFAARISRTMVDLFLHLVQHYPAQIPAYFYEEGGLSKLLWVIQAQAIPIDGRTLGTQIAKSLARVGPCDVDGQIARAIQEIVAWAR